MYSKLQPILAALLIAAAPAIAQIEDDSMGDLNAWGQRYLAAGEAEFATTLWRGSDTELLLTLFEDLKVTRMTPAERRLLRRLVLSPAEAPKGDGSEQLLAERARLMLALGEARAAAALVPNLESAVRGLDAETLAVDLDMAAGREATACSRLNGPLKDGAYWLKLRAVCAVLVDNFSGAELAIEFAEAQGISDDWMVAAIFAASGDVPEPPNARYDSGLNIALSTKAELDTSRITLSGSRPDLAAAAAQRPGVPLALKARFAQIAREIDLISAQAQRTIVLERLAQDDYEPSNSLEIALAKLTAPETEMTERAAYINRTLGTLTRTDLARYRTTAQLLLPDLRRLRAGRDVTQYALRFARASFAAGDAAQARRWLASLEREGAAPVDPFELALLEAIDLMSGGDDSSASQRAIADRLVESVNTPEQQLQAANLFSLWTGLGYTYGPAARALLADLPIETDRLEPAERLQIAASADAGAVAETALRILIAKQRYGDRLSRADTALFLRALQQIGAPDIAGDMALEASAYWQEKTTSRTPEPSTPTEDPSPQQSN